MSADVGGNTSELKSRNKAGIEEVLENKAEEEEDRQPCQALMTTPSGMFE